MHINKKIVLTFVFILIHISLVSPKGAAGILPYTIKDNNLIFLIGLDASRKNIGGWTDFGGTQEGNESDLETAIREGSEETIGVIKDLKQRTKTSWDKGYVFKKKGYCGIVVHVPYIKAKVFHQARNKSTLAVEREKVGFAWVTWTALTGPRTVPNTAIIDSSVKDTIVLYSPFMDTLKLNDIHGRNFKTLCSILINQKKDTALVAQN